MSTLKEEQKKRIRNENRVIELRIEKIKNKIVDPRIREEEDKGEPFMLKYPNSEAAKSFDVIIKKIREQLEIQII